jgi:dolichol-phosphate mannosyltransferase
VRPLVLIPTYNERDNLTPLVNALMKIDDLRVMIVDDDSPDGTGDVAQALVANSDGRVSVMRRTGHRGFGRSYLEGMAAALRTDATHICQMDADLSHDPAAIPRLLAACTHADLVIGSRYVSGGEVGNWPAHRVMLSHFANWYVRAITRLPVHDCTSGFRCWRRDLLARLPLDRIVSDGYAFQVELAWEAHAAGSRIVEVPITFVERREGHSKMSGRVIAESVLLPWKLAARPRLKQ